LAQVKGVGDVTYLGQLDYSMRAWLDPNRMAARDLSASDVSKALQEQNVQVAAGSLGRPPVPQGQAFQYTLSTLGRLIDPAQFGNIVVKTAHRLFGVLFGHGDRAHARGARHRPRLHRVPRRSRRRLIPELSEANPD
jgi:multidrug efflux pump subunit AcrB